MQNQKNRFPGLFLLITLSYFLLYTSPLDAQQSTSGPKRPPGVSKGMILDIMAIEDRVIIDNVPSYDWYRGCGPTALGMIVGYYDSHGFSDLIPGSAATQTSDVNNAIANDQHYNDYSLPLDSPPNLLSDNSELGGAHASNSIADFMQTSWSSEGNYWGWSWSNDIAPSFSNYVSFMNSKYIPTTSYEWFSTSSSWGLYITEIDNNRPIVLLVDSDGNGSTDHFVTGIGYDPVANQYAIYDTWDHDIHWYDWRGLSAGNQWGIYGFDMLSIENSAIRELTLTSTTINDETQTGSEPVFTVAPGDPVSGSFTVGYVHNQPESHVIPLGATPNWGNRETDYWSVASDISNGSSTAGNISLTAPAAAGTYYIILAAQSEYTVAQVLSATSWHEPSPVWNDGNDIVDLTEAQLEETRITGTIINSWLNGTYTDIVYGVTAIKLIVEESAIRELILTSTTINDETQTGSEPVFTVAPGDPVSGSFTVGYVHNQPESHVIPLGATPNWGNRETDYWSVASDISNGSSTAGNISLTAPDAAGTYYIILAAQSEYTVAQVLSATSWHEPNPVWYDGNDIVDLTEAQLEETRITGTIINSWLNETYSDIVYGVTAIKLIVEDPGTCLLPDDWEVNAANFSINGEIVAQVIINDVAVENGYLAAFVDGECRGVTQIALFPPSGQYIFTLLCFSNAASGEMLSFKYFDDETCTIVEPLSPEYEFVADMILGNATNPLPLYSCVDYKSTFQIGWNWFSVNTLQEDMTLVNILGCVSDGDYIKNQVSSATYYDEFGWFGTLEELDPTELYKMKVLTECGIDFCGTPVDVINTPISIVSGWNWIGYLPQEQIPIGEALGSLTLAEDDYIKNQVSSATYYDGYGWYGSLEHLVPTEGYMMKKISGDILTYPVSSSGATAAKPLQVSSKKGVDASINPQQFEFSGSITAKVYMDGSLTGHENDMILAYVNDQLRGVAQTRYFEPDEAYAFPMMVYSNLAEGENITFMYYDAEVNQLYSCKESLVFSEDMIVANAFESFELNVNSTVGLENLNGPNGLLLNAFPNPFADQIHITYSVDERTKVRLAVYDMLGKVIEILDERTLDPGSYSLEWNAEAYPEATYLLRLTTENVTLLKKIILIK